MIQAIALDLYGTLIAIQARLHPYRELFASLGVVPEPERLMALPRAREAARTGLLFRCDRVLLRIGSPETGSTYL